MPHKFKALPVIFSSILAAAGILIPDGQGKPAFAEALCGGVGQAKCPFEPAVKIGNYKGINLNCPPGAFFDPIYGGTCWKCPPDWIRSANKVTDDDACWRAAREELTSAVFVAKKSFAWECPGGSFWDGRNWGECWKCPDDAPRRTSYAVTDGRACARDLPHQTGKATFVRYNGCDYPRKPGYDQPFFDPQNGGECWACPPMSIRTVLPVSSREACQVVFRWKTPLFKGSGEPGLYGLDGTKEMLIGLFNQPEIVTTFLYRRARENGANTPTTANQYVADRWNEIATAPHNSDDLKALVLLQLMGAAVTPDQNTLSPAAKQLVQSFQTYIRERRTFIAQDALNMYDAWKAGNDYQKTMRARSSLEVAFDYGTAPPNFYDTAMDGLGLGIGGAVIAGGVGSIASAAAYGNTIGAVFNSVFNTQLQAGSTAVSATNAALKATRAISIFGGLQSASTAGAIVSGSTIVSAIGAVLTSVAIDQFIAIVTARPKLEAALQTAQQPVDLRAMLNTDDAQQLPIFWSMAMRPEYKVEQNCFRGDSSRFSFDSAYPRRCESYFAVKDVAVAAAQKAQSSGYPVVADTPQNNRSGGGISGGRSSGGGISGGGIGGRGRGISR